MTQNPTLDYPADVKIPSYQGIRSAFPRLRDYINRTPLLTSRILNERATAAITHVAPDIKVEVALKCENFQKIGAFKYRGACNALLRHIDGIKAKNTSSETIKLLVYTHLSGNFAQAIASSAKNLSTEDVEIKAVIIMPVTAPKSKKDAVLEYGAEVVDCENHERASVCEREMQKARQAGKEVVYFPSYDHVDVIEGHGSIMLEVEEQAKKIWGEKGRPDVVVCPIGGGGLISGVSLAAKGVYGAEGVAIVGVEPEGADDTYRSIESGVWQPAVHPTRTICDGLLTPSGYLTLPTIKRNVDKIVLADDESSIRAMRFVWERMKIIIEPSCATAVAAILGHQENDGQASRAWSEQVARLISDGRVDHRGVLRICIIISGGNVSFDKVLGWFAPKERGVFAQRGNRIGH